METREEPRFRVLGVAFGAPVATLASIKPASEGGGQIARAVWTILVSAAILAVTTYPNWHVSHELVHTQYSAFGRSKFEGTLAIQIGLTSATINLKGSVPDLSFTRVDSREKLIWSHDDDMKRQHRDALQRGVPFPILTAIEHLTWSRAYHPAGTYVVFFLWSAFAFCLLTNILWSLDEFCSVACLFATGCLLLLSNLIYSFNLPHRPLVIPYDGKMLYFSYGYCYYITLIVGSLCASYAIFAYASLNRPEAIAISNKLKSWREQFTNSQKIQDSLLRWSQRPI